MIECDLWFGPPAQWFRSLLSIGGIICNFAPILPCLQHWGINLDHDFVQMRKFSGDQKKISKWNTFSPNSGEDQKKKVFHKNRTLFFPKFTPSDVHPFNSLGGMQMWTILKLLRGIQPNYWGDISPIPPLFRNPCPL